MESVPQKKVSESAKPLRSSLLIAAMMLISRILGLLRDMFTAAVIGMSSSPAADAFFLAFRVPNLGRRLIEEGALGLSWIPAFSALWHKDRKEAWRLLSVFLQRGASYGLGLVIIGELFATVLLYAVNLSGADSVPVTAIGALHILRLMLPYLFFALLTAECAATLQATGRFGVAAAVAMIFNIFWLIVLAFISPVALSPIPVPAFFGYSPDVLTPTTRTAVLSCTIVAAAAAQFLIQRTYLTRIARRENIDTAIPKLTEKTVQMREHLRTVTGVFRQMLPTAAGLLFVQINTLLATLAATWLVPYFASGELTKSGSAAAIYFAERLYEFPLGLIGVAMGTAFYPLLVKRSADRDFSALSADLITAVRAIFLFSIPAAVGLFVLSEPLTVLLFQRGDFTPEDTRRTAALIRLFAAGVPIFCVQPVLIRTFYALGNLSIPLRAGIFSTAFFLITAVLLLATGNGSETGLVAGVVIGALIQTVLLAYRLSGRYRLRLFASSRFYSGLIRAIAGSAVMGLVIFAVMYFSGILQTTIRKEALWVAGSLILAFPSYFGTLFFTGEREIFQKILQKGLRHQRKIGYNDRNGTTGDR